MSGFPPVDDKPATSPTLGEVPRNTDTTVTPFWLQTPVPKLQRENVRSIGLTSIGFEYALLYSPLIPVTGLCSS